MCASLGSGPTLAVGTSESGAGPGCPAGRMGETEQRGNLGWEPTKVSRGRKPETRELLRGLLGSVGVTGT